MNSIDERIVEMKFNNAQFEKGVKETTSSLDKLKQGLKLEGATKGLNGVSAASKNLGLGSIASGVSTISSKFTALGLLGVGALLSIGSQAVNTGMQMAKSLTIDPIMDGFREYELKMGSIQTILANTARHGTGLEEVTANLDDLNTYADKTIYNFADMTRNIGLFTNAGIKIDDATSMIKGFSNEAAASGTSAQGAAGAAYQLSQALSAGTIRLMDWRSLQNVGMGNKNMQNGLIELADTMGMLDEAGISSAEVQKDFNGSLEKNWLSADVMSTYLKIMAGDMDEAAMKSIGLSETQIKSFQDQQKMSEEAATKVRTFTQLIGTLQEGVGSSWAQTFDLLLGDFNQATELFTGISDTLGGMIGAAGDARNKLIGEWVDLGGRDVAIEALGNAFKALMAILTPVGQAFRQVFPPTTAATLMKITEAIRDFSKGLIIGEETSNNLKRTFAGVFAVLSILWGVIKGVAGVFAQLFGSIFQGTGSILGFTAGIGDFLVGLDQTIKKSGIFERVFGKVGDVLKTVTDVLVTIVDGIVAFGKTIGSSLSGMSFDLGPLTSFVDTIKSRFQPLSGVIDWIGGMLDKLKAKLFPPKPPKSPYEDTAKDVGKSLSGIEVFMNKVIEALGSFDDTIANIFEGFSWSTVFDALNTGLFAGLILLVRNFFKGKSGDKNINLEMDFGLKELAGSIKEVFGGLTDSLKTMQTAVKAATILQIAIALALLAGSLFLLATIDSKKLTAALGALSILFGELIASMKLITSVTSGKELGEIIALTAAMILLGIAMNLMAAAVKQLSGLDWKELAVGLAGVAGMLLMVTGAAKLMKGSTGSLIGTAIGMVALGVALRIMVPAVKSLSELSWEELGKGLLGVAAIMLMMGGVSKLLDPKSMISVGIGMGIMALSVRLLASGVKVFADIDTDSMISGLIGLATTVGILVAAMRLMPKNLPVLALSFALIGWSLNEFAKPMSTFSSMNWDEIGRSLVMLGGSLLILAFALNMMSGSIMGSASLVVASAALWVLVPLLVELGEMSWNEIGKAATILAASLAIIAGGMYLMTGIIAGAASLLVVIPALWVLVPLLIKMGEMSWEEIGKAVVILGSSLAIIAAGLYLMTGAIAGAAALVVVSGALAILTPILIAMSLIPWDGLLVALAGLAGVFTILGLAGLVLTPVIPSLMLLGVAIGLIGAGAMLAGAGLFLFSTGLAALGTAAVTAGTAIVTLLTDMIGLIPLAMQSFGNGIVSLATVITANAPVITGAFTALISSFLDQIIVLAPKISSAITAVLMSILSTINTNAPAIIKTFVNLASQLLDAVVKLAPKIREAAVVVINNILLAINQVAPNVIRTLGNLVSNLLDEIKRRAPEFTQKGMDIIISILNGIGNNIERMVKAAVDIVVKFLGAVEREMPRITKKGVDVVLAFIRGIKDNTSRLVREGYDMIIEFVNELGDTIRERQDRMNAAGKNLANAIINGMTGGLWDGISKVTSAAKDVANDALNAAKDFLGIASPSKEFKKIGKFSDEGFALGLTAYSGVVEKSAKGVGVTALGALGKSMSKVPSVIDNEMEYRPRITPVLDISNVKNNVGKMDDLLGGKSRELKVRATSRRLSQTALERRQAIGRPATNPGEVEDNNVGRGVTYIQNNYSPKALSRIDIYRNTKTQIAATKGGLTLNANPS